MIKYLVHSDLHIFGAHEILSKPYDQAGMGEVEVFLGDNIEINNCKKKHVKDAIETLKQIQSWYKVNRLPFVTGNHELNVLEDSPVVAVHDQNLFIHGDLMPLWPLKKGLKYRNKNKPGTNFFMFNVVVPLFSFLRSKYRCYKINDDMMNRAVSLAREYKCKNVVCGHGHPEKIKKRSQDGVTLWILPRGSNKINL